MFEFGDDFLEVDGDLFPTDHLCCFGGHNAADLGDGVWVVDSSAVQMVSVSFVASPPVNVGVGYRLNATSLSNDR